MSRHPGINPFVLVPRDERHRLMTVANLALLEMHGGQAGPVTALFNARYSAPFGDVQICTSAISLEDAALADLQAVVVVVTELLQHYHVEEGRQAVLQAAGALAGVEACTTTTAAAAAACVPLIEVFAALLTVATLKRLEDAKAVARAQAATPSPRGR